MYQSQNRISVGEKAEDLSLCESDVFEVIEHLEMRFSTCRVSTWRNIPGILSS